MENRDMGSDRSPSPRRSGGTSDFVIAAIVAALPPVVLAIWLTAEAETSGGSFVGGAILLLIVTVATKYALPVYLVVGTIVGLVMRRDNPRERAGIFTGLGVGVVGWFGILSATIPFEVLMEILFIQ